MAEDRGDIHCPSPLPNLPDSTLLNYIDTQTYREYSLTIQQREGQPPLSCLKYAASCALWESVFLGYVTVCPSANFTVLVQRMCPWTSISEF